MENIVALSLDQIEENLKSLPGWVFVDDKIKKEFVFDNFMDAIGFVRDIAPFCELNDHHPDIHIFYKKIIFELSRFDIGRKVTDKDFLVAREIERLYLRR